MIHKFKTMERKKGRDPYVNMRESIQEYATSVVLDLDTPNTEF